MEEWRDVVGYEGLYRVSNLGRVKSLDRTVPHKGYGQVRLTGRPIKPALNSDGYQNVVLCNGQSRTMSVHRLVADSFLGPKTHRVEVDHINRDRTDNRLANLRYVNRSGNMRNTLLHDNRAGKYIGTYWHKRDKRWVSHLSVSGRRVNLGNYMLEKEAARAYDEYCIKNNLDRELNHA